MSGNVFIIWKEVMKTLAKQNSRFTAKINMNNWERLYFLCEATSFLAPIFVAFAYSRNMSPHYICVWENLFPHHLHSFHNSFERTSQTQTELSFYTEVPNSPRLLLAHVVQNHIWVDPLEPRCLLTAWIENSFLMYHPTFDLLFLDYVRFSCLKEEHFKHWFMKSSVCIRLELWHNALVKWKWHVSDIIQAADN